MGPSLDTVADAFATSAAVHRDRPFLCVLPETAAVYGIAAGELTYRECADRITALRTAYAAAGYGHGHRVGLLLGSRPSFWLHWFALDGLGVSVVPIGADLRSTELEYLVGHSGIALAVAPQANHAALRQAAAAAGRSMPVAGIDNDLPAAPFAPPLTGQAVGVRTECALLYTSGTTGRPKGCILPNRYFLRVGQWYSGIGGLAELHRGSERMLTPLPLVHMNAMAYSTMAMAMTGGCLIALDRFHPKSWWDSVRHSQATVVHYLGVMPALLMQAAPGADDRRHQVRFGFGAGVDGNLHAPFEERFGFPLLEAWAMTETGAGAVIIANREPRLVGTRCFGRESEDVEVMLIDEDGRQVSADQPGELLVRHAGDDPRDGFFAGYLGDEAATEEAWAGGWFHTGDIVSRDADGYLHFVDRRKNLIRRSGENISAAEVESVLLRHPQVQAAAVAAVPDAVRGEEVLACVVSETVGPGADARRVAANDIVAWCLSQLAYYKAPGYVAFVDALPLTTAQKLQRAELGALARSLVGQPNCIDTLALKKRPA
jgi:acyl-CoA synthetase (AMP-forming)/AMP-acid ligase II